MKARPRHAERRIAEILTLFFASRNLDPVERVPVIGRTGPDLSLNQCKLVCDVKSRLSVPISYIQDVPMLHDGLVCIPLVLLPGFDGSSITVSDARKSKTVEDFYLHMLEWTQKKVPDGITALVLHKPGLKFDKAQFVLHQAQVDLFLERTSL